MFSKTNKTVLKLTKCHISDFENQIQMNCLGKKVFLSSKLCRLVTFDLGSMYLLLDVEV